MRGLTIRLLIATIPLAATAALAADPAKAPFPYVPGKAYHILPETHSDESGYFSLCEGRDGKIYVGTAKYGVNSYLVEFDPKTEKQRIVIDTHKVCGVSATGYAAQAKIHTPNFVGPSGIVYVGSKQGYPKEGDKQEFGGGYVMTYDPKTDKAQNLGMPLKGYGVGDVVADEARGLIYVVAERVKASDPMRWLLYDMKSKKYRELPGVQPTPYATTLVDKRGRANILTDGDTRLAQYDPATDKLTVRDIIVAGRKYMPPKPPIPTWQLAADKPTAYMILMSDPTLLAIDLDNEGGSVQAKSLGKMIAGKGPDCRCGLYIGPDGRVYAVIRVDNETKFGSGYLHHLTRYDPKAGKMEDLGVLTVKNPDFFNFGPRADGKAPPWSQGYDKLPDGTLTPLYHHMALIVARDGTVYVTILYPFTLLRVELAKRE
jgi:hypothetical protein